jgi:hypothetical protein
MGIGEGWTSPGSVDTTSEQISLRARLPGGSRGFALAVGIRETAIDGTSLFQCRSRAPYIESARHATRN